MGWHTVLELARAGSEVILTVRSEDKGRAAVERIGRLLPVHASVGSCWILQASGQCARLRSAWNASLAWIFLSTTLASWRSRRAR